jgi:hypothetical protein
MHAIKWKPAALGIALILAFTSVPAHAQAVFGAAELDDDETQLYLLGGAWAPGGLGWKPFGSVVAYHLRFDAFPEDVSRNVVLPTLGLMHAGQTQSISFGVGYAFADDDTDDDTNDPALVGAPSGDGVVASVGWDYWGDGSRMAQVLGSFNFGDEYLWSRGRAGFRLTPTSPLFVGGEAGIMGGGDDNAFIAQFGPLIEWRFNPQFRLTASAGLKVGVAEVEGNAAYGRLEFLWLPLAR